MKEEEYKRFTVSLPEDLYKEFEIFREKLDISRSDGIRKAMKAYMISEENISDATIDVAGSITLIMVHEHFKQIDDEIDDHDHEHAHEDHDHPHAHPHPHAQKEHNHKHEHDYVSKPIYANVQQTDMLKSTDIQHHYGDVIKSTMHIHLEFEKCMEIIAVTGPYSRVLKLKENLQRLKSVLSIGLFVVDKEEEK